MPETMPLLEVKGLSVSLRQAGRDIQVTDHVDFSLHPGEVLALVGESGCGKTVTCLSLLRLLPADLAGFSGQALFEGRDLLALPQEEMRALRGSEIAMVFQEPSAALNPLLTIRQQMRLPFRHHDRMGEVAEKKIPELLRRAGFPDPDRILGCYPHELSGGMLQRVLIAHALLLGPKLLLADEPTTALDVTVQAQVLDLLAELQRGTGLALILVTHNLNLVAQYAHRAAVMYAGRIVEQGPASALLANPRHPYTRGLLAALPRMDGPVQLPKTIPGAVPSPDRYPTGCRYRDRCPEAFEACATVPEWTKVGVGHRVACHLYVSSPPPSSARGTAPSPRKGRGTAPRSRDAGGGVTPLLSARNLSVHFPIAGGLFRKTVGAVRAVHNVSLDINPGEVVALVGESGCGKSTLGMSLLGLTPPTSGEISLLGKTLDIRKPSAWKPYRREFQIVFQDPVASMNPRLTMFELLSEPLRAHGIVKPPGLRTAAAALLDQVGLSADMLDRFPHAFSGGQRQRVCIARALGLSPKVLVCDEIVSALDVSVQAQILHLLMDLKAAHGLSLLFITHDLSLVRSIADRVLVMYLGSMVESAPAAEFFRAPVHPYSRALLDAVPTLDSKRKPKSLSGEIPSAAAPPAGCAFAGRCVRVLDRCRSEEPVLVSAGARSWACFNPLSP